MDNRFNIFLDNNIFDQLLIIPEEDRQMLIQYCNIYTCDTITNELVAIGLKNPDKLEQINLLKQQIHPIRGAFFGFCTYNNPHPENVGGFATHNPSSPGGIWYTYETHAYRHKVKEFLDTYGKKKKKGKTNDNDVKIAILAFAHNTTLITQDGVPKDFPVVNNKQIGLYQAVKECGGKVMCIQELLDYLKKGSNKLKSFHS